MELKLDLDKFEERQKLFVKRMVEDISIQVREAGLTGLEMENLTATIAMRMASNIDDMAAIEENGIEARPYLTFRDGDDDLLHCGENSYLYDYVKQALDKLFDV